jgi:hypothetical protein
MDFSTAAISNIGRLVCQLSQQRPPVSVSSWLLPAWWVPLSVCIDLMKRKAGISLIKVKTIAQECYEMREDEPGLMPC